MAEKVLYAFVDSSTHIPSIQEIGVDLPSSLIETVLLSGKVELRGQAMGNPPVCEVREPGVVTTLCGSLKGHLDAPLDSARFMSLVGMVYNSKQNYLLVTDYEGNVIRKIDRNGVTTLAGSNEGGFQDGMKQTCLFNYPQRITHFLSADVFFVCDLSNHRIRKVTPEGEVTTYAGNGKAMCKDGGTLNASFIGPIGITIDQRNGDLYVTCNDHTVRKVSKGLVTTIAGKSGEPGSTNGVGVRARFNSPKDICFSEKEACLFIADRFNHQIRKIDKNGIVTSIAGIGSPGSMDGDGTKAVFYNPQALAYIKEQDTILVGEPTKIRTVKPNGGKYFVETIAGGDVAGLADGELLQSKFRNICGICVDYQTKTCFVADNYRIRAFSLP